MDGDDESCLLHLTHHSIVFLYKALFNFRFSFGNRILYERGLAADLKVRPEGCQIFPTNIVSRKISKCQNISKCCISSSWNSYLRCIKGTACLANIAKHSLKTSPIKPHYETLDCMNQQFEQAVHQEEGG